MLRIKFFIDGNYFSGITSLIVAAATPSTLDCCFVRNTGSSICMQGAIKLPATNVEIAD